MDVYLALLICINFPCLLTQILDKKNGVINDLKAKGSSISYSSFLGFFPCLVTQSVTCWCKTCL